ncbi:MAG: hypothetical protein ABIW94_07585 [Gemmatimonadaceae bacterium]
MRDEVAAYGGPSLVSDAPALVLAIERRTPDANARVILSALNRAVAESSVAACFSDPPFSLFGEIHGRWVFSLACPPGSAALDAARQLCQWAPGAPDGIPIVSAFDKRLEKAWARELDDWRKMEPLIAAARSRGIPVRLAWYGGLPALHLGDPGEKRMVLGPFHHCDSAVAGRVGSDKQLTRSLLEELRVPMPRGIAGLSTWDETRLAAAEIGYPIVLKHVNSSNSFGVVPEIRSFAALDRAWRQLRLRFPIGHLLVERFIPGTYYRILVIDGTYVRASNGTAVSVCGDGVRTVTELVRAAGPPCSGFLDDEDLLYRLRSLLIPQDLELSSTPAPDRRVQVTPPTTQWVDCTNDVHPDTRAVTERIGQALAPGILGIDIVCWNIGEPLTGDEGIIEVNSGPGTWFHADQAGLASLMLQRLFEDYDPPRVVLFAGPAASALAAQAEQASRAARNPAERRTAFVWTDEDFAIAEGLPAERCDVLVITGQLREPLLSAVLRSVIPGGAVIVHPACRLPPRARVRLRSIGVAVSRAAAEPVAPDGGVC